MAAVRRDPEALGVARLQAQLRHDRPGLVAARIKARLFQFARQAPGAVGAPGTLENPGGALFHALPFPILGGRLGPLGPRIVGAPAHLHHAAQRGNGVGLLLLLDEPVSHPSSFAKKAAAFFNISRSIRNRSFSLADGTVRPGLPSSMGASCQPGHRRRPPNSARP